MNLSENPKATFSISIYNIMNNYRISHTTSLTKDNDLYKYHKDLLLHLPYYKMWRQENQMVWWYRTYYRKYTFIIWLGECYSKIWINIKLYCILYVLDYQFYGSVLYLLIWLLSSFLILKNCYMIENVSVIL